jgi:hypothetical protein
MNTPDFKYEIRSSLPPNPEAPDTLGAKFLNTLDALSRIAPKTFIDWQVIDFRAPPPIPLALVRPRIAEIIETGVHRTDDESPPEPIFGYTAGAVTNSTSESRDLTLMISGGGKVIGGYTWLQTGEWKVSPDPLIVTYSIFKAAILTINAIWPPSWACAYAYSKNYDTTLKTAEGSYFPYSIFNIPWIGYLSRQLATRLLLPPTEIITERTPDGGLLMIATEERLDPTNPEHLRRARIIAQTMIARTSKQPKSPQR